MATGFLSVTVSKELKFILDCSFRNLPSSSPGPTLNFHRLVKLNNDLWEDVNIFKVKVYKFCRTKWRIMRIYRDIRKVRIPKRQYADRNAS